jgi:hypothetical protein
MARRCVIALTRERLHCRGTFKIFSARLPGKCSPTAGLPNGDFRVSAISHKLLDHNGQRGLGRNAGMACVMSGVA